MMLRSGQPCANRLVLRPQYATVLLGNLDLLSDGVDVGLELFRVVGFACAVLDLGFADLRATLGLG